MAPVFGTEEETVEEKSKTEETPKSLFLCCEPGKPQNGFQVVPADDEDDAVTIYAKANGISKESVPANDDGDPVAEVAVVELSTVSVDFDAVAADDTPDETVGA